MECCKTMMEGEDKINEEDRILEIQFEFILDLAKEKYEYENKRREELIQQSGQMQAAFSFLTAAIFMALPVAMDHPGNLSVNFFLLMTSVIVFFLLLSLVLASIAAWRWDRKTLGNITEIKKKVIECDEWEKFQKRYHRLNAEITALEEVQVNNETINNKRALLIRWSMVAFWFSIGNMVLFYCIAIYKLWH